MRQKTFAQKYYYINFNQNSHFLRTLNTCTLHETNFSDLAEGPYKRQFFKRNKTFKLFTCKSINLGSFLRSAETNSGFA